MKYFKITGLTNKKKLYSSSLDSILNHQVNLQDQRNPVLNTYLSFEERQKCSKLGFRLANDWNRRRFVESKLDALPRTAFVRCFAPM